MIWPDQAPQRLTQSLRLRPHQYMPNAIGVPADALAVTVYGHAVLGSSGQGTPFVAYAANDQIATYEAVGTTIIGFAINLIE